MKVNELSQEALISLVAMIEYCINYGKAMGMHEGINLDTMEKLPFVKELESFASDIEDNLIKNE